MVPKYIPFERSDTWSAAISGSGAANADGAANRAAATAAVSTSRNRTGRTLLAPARQILQILTNGDHDLRPEVPSRAAEEASRSCLFRRAERLSL